MSLASFSQGDLSSDEAMLKYKRITAEMEKSFPEDDFKTYRRESFSENQLQIYLSQLFQRMDLLKQIEGNHLFKMESYLHSGNWFKDMGFPKESIKWCNTFLNYYHNHKEDFTEKEKSHLTELISYVYSIQAESYAKIGDFHSAQLEHKRNIEFIKEVDIIGNPSAYNNYGLFFYWYKKDLDSALVYFNKAYDITISKFPNHTLLGSIRDNIADVFLDKNQPEKALPLYRDNFSLYKKTKNEKSNQYDIPRLISAGTQLIKTQLLLNQVDDAKETWKSLNITLKDKGVDVDKINSSKLELLQAEEALYLKLNDYQSAYHISQNRLKVQDSINILSKLEDKKWQAELNAISLDRVALNFKIDKIEKENKINNQRSKLWIVSLTSSIVLILLLSLFLRRRQYVINTKNKQLLAEQELENTALKNQQLQSEIESKKRDLSDFAINLTQNQQWAKELADKIKTIRSVKSKEQQIMLNDLEKDIINKTTVDSETQEFYERLDKLSDSFYSELTTKFPNLSKTEVRLCSLIRLKMDSRSIATLQNITQASLNTSRYRLRKKLNLTEEIDLDEFIQNL